MERRKFITLLGSAAAASSVSRPRLAHAQQADRVRRIGVLVSGAERDPEVHAWLAGFRQGLERLGWLDGRNIHIDYRYAAGIAEQFQPLAKELLALQPDVILAHAAAVAATLQRESRTIPIVFVAA